LLDKKSLSLSLSLSLKKLAGVTFTKRNYLKKNVISSQLSPDGCFSLPLARTSAKITKRRRAFERIQIK